MNVTHLDSQSIILQSSVPFGCALERDFWLSNDVCLGDNDHTSLVLFRLTSTRIEPWPDQLPLSQSARRRTQTHPNALSERVSNWRYWRPFVSEMFNPRFLSAGWTSLVYAQVQGIYSVFLRAPGNGVYLANAFSFWVRFCLLSDTTVQQNLICKIWRHGAFLPLTNQRKTRGGEWLWRQILQIGFCWTEVSKIIL